MNEKQFAKHILESVKNNVQVETWYKQFMENTSLSETEDRIIYAINNTELTLKQAIQLSIFIGLTTKID